jgi:hypothetical protein
MNAILFTLHFAATWSMVGICWLVQRVQYPLMAEVGRGAFPGYEAAHVARIGPVVAPLMLAELVTGVALWLAGDAAFRKPAFSVSMLLLGIVWLSTFLVQVPLHDALGAGFDGQAHAALVRTNWVRTLAWSARGLLLGFLLFGMLRASAGTTVE